MKNNILGGLVIFMVVVTCLLLLDDISNPKEDTSPQDTVSVQEEKPQTDLAIVDLDE